MTGTQHRDWWVDPEDDPRSWDGALLGDERTTLVEYLRHYRLTLRMKCAGLNAEQLAMRSVAPSNLSLLGLVRHMAHVEQRWFRVVMAGEELPFIYRTPDDRDADFNAVVGEPAMVDEAFAHWDDEIANAEQYVDSAESLDQVSLRAEDPINLREVLVHMIEEYARHCGHADLIRERIDGATGP